MCQCVVFFYTTFETNKWNGLTYDRIILSHFNIQCILITIMCIHKLLYSKHNAVFIPSILSDWLNSQSDGMLTMFSQFDRILKMKIVWCIFNTKTVLYAAYSMMNCYAFLLWIWFDYNVTWFARRDHFSQNVCELIFEKGQLLIYLKKVLYIYSYHE